MCRNNYSADRMASRSSSAASPERRGVYLGDTLDSHTNSSQSEVNRKMGPVGVPRSICPPPCSACCKNRSSERKACGTFHGQTAVSISGAVRQQNRPTPVRYAVCPWIATVNWTANVEGVYSMLYTPILPEKTKSSVTDGILILCFLCVSNSNHRACKCEGPRY